MNVSEFLVRYLRALGVRHVFGYPGDPTVELLESCRRENLDFVLARREGTAGLMAEAAGMLTGLPGVCVSTLGPGSTNLVNAVANAWLDRVPMLAISGQIESKREPYFTHQVVDQERIFAPVCKWATTIQPHTAAIILRKAVRTAMAERPGPVHMTLAADVVGAQAVDDRIVLPPLAAQELPFAFGTEAAVAGVVAKIRGARRPVILAGIAAVRGNASASLARLAEALGCPVVVAPMAKGVLAEDHPALCRHAGHGLQPLHVEVPRRRATSSSPRASTRWSSSSRGAWMSRPSTSTRRRTPTRSTPRKSRLVGPVAAILDALAGGLCRRAPLDGGARSPRTATRSMAKYYEGRVAGRLNPTDVIDVVRRAMPRETIATADVGSHKLLVGQGWTTYSPRSTLMTNGLSSMGFSLPAAIAAKLVHPERPVVCFTGDGGLAMVQGELRLAASLKIDPLVIVFCDNSLNRIELKQTQREYPSWGTLIDATDIEKLAQSMGCDGAVADSAAGLERILAQPRAATRPLVVGVHIDPAQYLAQF